MKDSFNLLKGDKIIKISLILSIILIFLQSILVALYIQKLPPLIPLLNSQPWGTDRLYPSWTLILLPAVLIIVFLINYMISSAFYKSNTLIARILAFNSLLFTVLSLSAFVQIILLVF